MATMLASRLRRAAAVAWRYDLHRSFVDSCSRLPLWRIASAGNGAWIETPEFSGSSKRLEYFARGFAAKAEITTDDFTSLCKSIESKYDAVQAVTNWIDEGHALSNETLVKLVTWMSDKRKFVQALQLLKAAREKNLTEVSAKQLALEITLYGRQHSAHLVDELCKAMPEELRNTSEVNKALLLFYVNERRVPKVEKFLQEAKEISTQGWDVVLDMYLKRDKFQKVLATYTRMKEAGVEFSVRTYATLLACKDVVGGYEGIESEAKEFLAKVDLESAPGVDLEEMLAAYGYLKDLEGVDRIWSALKKNEPRRVAHYIAMKAFGMAGDISKAEEVLEELAALTTNFGVHRRNPYAAMIEVYASLGMMDKAEELLQKKAENELKDNNWPYDALIAGYLATGDTGKAVKKFKDAVAGKKEVTLRYKSVMGLLAAFASRKNLASSKKVMFLYTRYFGDVDVYNQFLKVYVAVDKAPHEFRKRMEKEFIEPNEETEKLLKILDEVSAKAKARKAAEKAKQEAEKTKHPGKEVEETKQPSKEVEPSKEAKAKQPRKKAEKTKQPSKEVEEPSKEVEPSKV